LTFLIWGCYYLQLYLACQAFSFTSGLTVLAVLVVFVLSSIGMGIPTNGGLGAWHVATIFGLSLYGVGVFSPSNFDPRASAFAMLVWGFQTLLVIVLGVYAFISMAIDRRRIEKGQTTVDTTNDEISL
ncbi:MAG: flippase-like domain-containing protein, partial [Muribaculaceae bacterium]|nr:flippase-like domain-containing protein [Muribaculaceae bacterium]